jgi:hypothetical protein
MTALERLRQLLADDQKANSVSFVSDHIQQSKESQACARARPHAHRAEEDGVTNYRQRIISPAASVKSIPEFSALLENATDKTDTIPPADEGCATMHRDLAVVVQDLLAEGKKPGHIRRMFGLSWAEIDRIRRNR